MVLHEYLKMFPDSFVHTKKKLVEQAQKALYAVYFKIRNLQLPIDLQLKIADLVLNNNHSLTCIRQLYLILPQQSLTHLYEAVVSDNPSTIMTDLM
jgi:hypothetical protein